MCSFREEGAFTFENEARFQKGKLQYQPQYSIENACLTNVEDSKECIEPLLKRDGEKENTQQKKVYAENGIQNLCDINPKKTSKLHFLSLFF